MQITATSVLIDNILIKCHLHKSDWQYADCMNMIANVRSVVNFDYRHSITMVSTNSFCDQTTTLRQLPKMLNKHLLQNGEGALNYCFTAAKKPDIIILIEKAFENKGE